MQRLLVATLLALPWMPAPHADASAAVDLRITEILPEPDTALGQREFVEVWNAGNTTVELAGWKVHDAPTTSGSTNTFTFPAWRLRPNARVVIWGGGAADGRGPAWGNGVAWNNAGDGVHLLDPAGRLADWAGYGAATPPPGFEPNLSPKPAKGLSTELESGAWVAHEPTPGAAPGATAGTLALSVSNVPPQAVFLDLPASARPGTSLAILLAITDGNGEADLHSWNLTSNGVLVAQGTALPAAITLTVPTGQSWTLAAHARDRAGLVARAEATLALRPSDLAVLVPAEGLALPQLEPGAAQATATRPLTLQNLGTAPLHALVDVSDFTGPAAFPAEGHLELGLDGGEGVVWTAYMGPLTRLGPLAPGESAQLWFRVVRLPVPLPAGNYGTSFTVVAG